MYSLSLSEIMGLSAGLVCLSAALIGVSGVIKQLRADRLKRSASSLQLESLKEAKPRISLEPANDNTVPHKSRKTTELSKQDREHLLAA